MKKITLLALSLIVGCLCSGCSTSNDRADFSDAYLSDRNFEKQPNYAQIREIPVPEKAIMDSKRTLLFGQKPLIGRLFFLAPYTQEALFDFYSQEMPKTRWKEVTAVRSDSSFLTFMKDKRIATIRLNSDTETTASVMIDISMSQNLGEN